MEFSLNYRKSAPVSIIDDSLQTLYPHDLTLYREPPSPTISLNEFEDIALDRVHLFRIIEEAGIKGHKLFSEDWKNCILTDLKKSGLKSYVHLASGSSNIEARRADHISHFILRIAYCRSEELRRWFLNREMEWFRLRFSIQSAESIKKFLELYNLAYLPISDEEKFSLREVLLESTSGQFIFETTQFYKVPFVQVCSLVRNRKVYIKEGLAYVPSFELIVCIMSIFRTELSQGLARYHRRLMYFDDDRINPLMENLHNIHTGNSYTIRENTDSIDPQSLDTLSKKHFPLCMRHMHEVLRTEHHLKHQARLIYGCFLKGIGLAYEDAVRFWREEFTKKIDSNKFDKEYLYDIKHRYGKVGKMTSYSPYSCLKIILTNVGPGEHHGCPFKIWDGSVLSQKMVELGISNQSAVEIKELAAGGHYQVACTKYFECVHGKAPSVGINHPNQYFEDSVKIENENSIEKS